MKFNFKKLLIIFPLLLLAASLGLMSASAMDLTSTSFIIRDPIIGTGGGYGTSTNFQLISAGNTILSGAASSTSFQTRYGFLYYSSPTTASITFDLDTATSDSQSSSPYTVTLGVLSTSAVARSNGSINSIWADLDTAASSGAVITVTSANGSLKSTSVIGDTIPSATATMAAGTANYGLCVVASPTATSGTFNRVSPYNGTCVDGASNAVGIVDGTARNILDSNSAPITGGRAQIRVNAAISPTTAAHNDYTDNLIFIATGTF